MIDTYLFGKGLRTDLPTDLHRIVIGNGIDADENVLWPVFLDWVLGQNIDADTLNGYSFEELQDLWQAYADTKDEAITSNTNRIVNLENNQTTGVVTYQTYAELPTTGESNVSYKVENDPNSSLNGYYSWVGSAYVPAASLANGIIVEGNVDAVSGGVVYTELQKYALNELVYFDKDELTQYNQIPDSFINNSGALINSVNYTVRVFDVSNIESVKISTLISGSGIAAYGYYSDQACTNLISLGPPITPGVETVYDSIVTPDAAMYLGVSYQNSGGSLFVYEKYTVGEYINDAVNLVSLDRYNIWGQSENLASAYYSASATKGTKVLMFKGVELTELISSNFFNNLESRFSTLGLNIFTVGKKYIASYYIINASYTEQFFWMTSISNTTDNGHNARLIDGNVRRVHVLCYATATDTIVPLKDPTLPFSNQTSSFRWFTQAATGGGDSANLRVGGFQIEQVNNDDYVDGVAAIGDSTIAGASGGYDRPEAREITTYMAGILNVPFFNRAIGGNTTQDMVSRWSTDITPLSLNCKYCIIQGGINDLAQSVDILTIQQNLQAMYDLAVVDNMIPILFTITPANIIVSAGNEPDRVLLNNWIKSTFPSVLDIASIVEDVSDISILRPDFEGDGTHYNIYAKRAIANACVMWDGWDFITPKPYQQVLGNVNSGFTKENKLDNKLGEISKIKGVRIFAESNNIDIAGRYQLK